MRRRRSPPTRPCASGSSRCSATLIAGGDWVAEGRDIGTVVAPDAEVKVCLTASRRGARPPPRRAGGPAGRRGPRRAARPRRARRARASTARCVARRRRRRGRHDRAGDRRGRARGSSRWCRDDEGRGRRLPERRQELAGQPPERLARGRRARAPGHHARPQRDPLRVERPHVHADRHRRHRPARRRPDLGLDPRAGRTPRCTTPTSRCWSSTPAPAMRPGDQEMADLLRRQPASRSSSPPTRSTRSATSRRPPSSTRSAWATRSPSRPRRAWAPATCSTRVVELLPERTRTTRPTTTSIRLAIIGRPNVGKSSLVNRFLGAERVIVSDVAGTTRDAIDLPLEVDGRRVILVDTAGLRRQAKVSESVEYYTALRSQRAAERADVAIVVCDATDGVTSAGPADRRAGDEERLRDAARAQQVGPLRGRRGRPRPRARPRRTASCACARR